MKSLTNWLCVIGILALLLFAEASCNTQKHINQKEEKTDSSAVQEYKRIIEEQRIFIAHQEQRIKEFETLGVTFVPAPPCPSVNMDSLKAVLTKSGCNQKTVDSIINRFNEISKAYQVAQTTIRQLKDGTLEIQGYVASLTKSRQRDEQIITDLKQENKIKDDSIFSLKTDLEKITQSKQKDSKTSTNGFLWWLLPIGIAIGLFIYHKFLRK